MTLIGRTRVGGWRTSRLGASVTWSHQRCSTLGVDAEQPVATHMIHNLIELACWAPNHKLMQPWRFCVVTPCWATRTWAARYRLSARPEGGSVAHPARHRCA
jgi:hypothetical protein